MTKAGAERYGLSLVNTELLTDEQLIALARHIDRTAQERNLTLSTALGQSALVAHEQPAAPGNKPRPIAERLARGEIQFVQNISPIADDSAGHDDDVALLHELEAKYGPGTIIIGPPMLDLPLKETPLHGVYINVPRAAIPYGLEG